LKSGDSIPIYPIRSPEIRGQYTYLPDPFGFLPGRFLARTAPVSDSSLRDIETTLHTQPQQRYHLGSPSISRSALGRANEQLDYGF